MVLNVKEIKAEMARQKLTASDLAKRACISRQSISAILKRGTCAIPNAGKIADALGIDVEKITKPIWRLE